MPAKPHPSAPHPFEGLTLAWAACKGLMSLATESAVGRNELTNAGETRLLDP